MSSHFDRLNATLGVPDAFPWQRALLMRWLDPSATMPSAIDIPTGLGKTSVMAIWLVARAAGADVPRRLIYVVDRRAVVDQATDVARRLRERVDADAALKRDLGLTLSLPISTLRGQFADNREWLEDPSVPAIVIGTVDMVGSRLLFGGYGVSRKMRPYHAGLIGTDSLIVLDEAHLVQPFERLIEQVASGFDAHGRALGPSSAADAAVIPPLRTLSLSATGRPRPQHEVVPLGNEDFAHPEVERRLTAAKRLVLRDRVEDKQLAEALASEAWAISREGKSPHRVLVFCTSRDHAQKVQNILLSRSKQVKVEIETELFVGGRRVHERTEASKWLAEHGFLAGTRARPTRATFVVATAAGEVGVDLDADHAISDLVAWERMVQRFGRVNRRGDGDATIVVVPGTTKDDAEAARRSAALELLDALPRTSADEIDVSLASLIRVKDDPKFQSLIDRASTPARLHPPLTQALVEAWSMTGLEDHTGRPEVAPWIRGWPDEPEEPQTTVVWRRHLPLREPKDGKPRLFGVRDLDLFRDAADPHLAERLETESWRVAEWLSLRVKSMEARREADGESERDAPGETPSVVGVLFDTKRSRAELVEREMVRDTKSFARLLEGATLMVDVRLGGLTSGLLNDEENGFATDVTEVESNDGETRVVPFRVRRVSAEAPREQDWRIEASVPLSHDDEAEPEWLQIESLIGQLASSEDGRSGAGRAQLLEAHEEWTEAEATKIADALALAPELRETLAVAARLHDEGKKAHCWQQAFNAPSGGSPPYGKTVGRPRVALLEGYRHELGSLPYAEVHPRVHALEGSLRELCLHMIAAHHGGARPVLRTSGAPEPPIRLEARAREIALRFASLSERWGPWGLAWWEALLRAADQRASRRNDLEGSIDG